MWFTKKISEKGTSIVEIAIAIFIIIMCVLIVWGLAMGGGLFCLKTGVC